MASLADLVRYSRTDLDELARTAGLDPRAYPRKDQVARALLTHTSESYRVRGPHPYFGRKPGETFTTEGTSLTGEQIARALKRGAIERVT